MIQIVLLTLAMLYGYYLWKKYDSLNAKWSLYPVAALLLLSLIQSVSESQLELSQVARELEFYIFTIIRLVVIGIFFIILFRK
jgi:hypothetical protein